MERVDIAIIGSGPAGLSAALNAKIRNKSFIVFGNNNLSNKITKASKINNYLGFYGVTGKDLAEKFKEHVASMDIKITEERVNNIYAMGEYFALMVNEKMYEAKAIILATGMEVGKTLEGIHHDDIVFVLDNNNLKEWGSEGQRKNAIISFKLAEISVINEIKGYYPILILDDLFSELDKEKVTNLLGMLDRNVQTFMTTTDLKNISKKVIKDAKKFKVNDGILEEE